jgi:signal transduction histidine kinase
MNDPIHILLVDDEARNLDALEAILDDPAYILLRAEDADRALRLLLDHDVAAIVLDIKMPGVSGFELAKMIKNTRRFRETPILFLTAYLVEDQDVIAGYGAGGVDYLTKPVNPQILRYKVAVLAELFRKTRELAEANDKLAEVNELLEERVEARTAELERSESALRAAGKQKDEFLAVLAHELRNPLAPIRTGIDLLVRLQDGSPKAAKILSTMGRQLDHIVRLVDDLLDISRLSRGFIELKKDQVDLVEIVRSTLDTVRPLFERRDQVLSLATPASLLVKADPTRIAQILTNLLHNAAKFTPAGGRVSIELAAANGEALLNVVDSGAGISPEHIEHIFDMFTRISRPGMNVQPGLGIGLALARRLAQLHGGTLSAFSAGEGQGARFTLRIPTLTAGDDARAPTAGGHPEPGISDQPPLDILVIEDNDDVADGLLLWLQDLGHRVSVARTGASGLEMIRRQRPAVVLCDLGLPEMDGLDVCRQVRTLPGESQPVMVAVTGWGREDDLRRTKDAGFDHHLVKPVALDRLLAVLRGLGSASARADSGP